MTSKAAILRAVLAPVTRPPKVGLTPDLKDAARQVGKASAGLPSAAARRMILREAGRWNLSGGTLPHIQFLSEARKARQRAKSP